MGSITSFGRFGQHKALRSDRKWFTQNPHREYRIRPLIPGEAPELHDLPPGNWTRWTCVRQLWPGFRARVFMAAPFGAVPVDADDVVADIFEFAIRNPNNRDVGRDTPGGQLFMSCFLPPWASGKVVAS
jgi:hypothetical protein